MININKNIIGKSLSNWVIISCEIDNDYCFRITLKNNITNQLNTTVKHLCCISYKVSYKELCPIIYIRNSDFIKKFLNNDVSINFIGNLIINIIVLDNYYNNNDNILEQICLGLVNKNKLNMLDKNQLDYMLLEPYNC